LTVTRITKTVGACLLAFLVGALVVHEGRLIELFSSEPRTDSGISATLIEGADDGGISSASAVGELVPSAIGVRSGARAFSLRATARRLFPGAKRPLRVRISNHSRFAIKVTRIRVRVKPDRTHVSCPPDEYVRKTRFTKSIRVRPRRSRRVRLAIRLLYSAPDACQGAAFPLRLRGTAVRA
jgi:hypothetical protein